MTSERDDQQGEGAGPDERREMVGNRTMQLDAVSDEILEDLDYPDRDEPSAAPPPLAPPPLPRNRGKRWSSTAVVALAGVVVMAALLGLLAASFIFGDEEPEAATAGGAGEAEMGATSEEARQAQQDSEDDRAEFVPLELDEIVIESGAGGDEPEGE